MMLKPRENEQVKNPKAYGNPFFILTEEEDNK
jgi:hypothetical protein